MRLKSLGSWLTWTCQVSATSTTRSASAIARTIQTVFGTRRTCELSRLIAGRAAVDAGRARTMLIAES